MENRTLDMQNPSPGSTQTERCRGCGATTTSTYKQVSTFQGRPIFAWVSEWPGGDLCEACEMRGGREVSAKTESVETARKRLEDQFGGPKTLAYTFASFEPIPNLPALQACQGFNPQTDSLYLLGPCGTGKSHLAIALARDQFQKGRRVAFFTASQLMREFRKRVEYPDREEGFLRFLWTVDVLVIDDIGVGKATEYALEKLHEIIDGRDKNFKQGLVITSNLGRTDLAQITKDRIPDRLNGLCTFITLTGESRRKKEGKNT